MTTPTDLSRLRLGTAPDSWGVWFPEDPHQVGWKQYLDEVADAGLRLDRARSAGLPAAGPGAAARRAGPARPEGLRRHRVRRAAQGQGGAGQGDRGVRPGGPAAARGRREVPRPPARAVHRHAHRGGHRVRRAGSGAVDEPGRGHQRAGPGPARGVRRRAGLPPARRHPRRHPGPDRAVPDDTDPQYVNLCLDTGHIAYCGGDNVQIIERLPDRITYVHLK